MFNRLKSKLVRNLYLRFDNSLNRRWYNYPFGNEPLASKEIYHSLAAEASYKDHPEIYSFEDKSGYAIDQRWFHELAFHTQVAVKRTEPCYQHGRVLYTALS